MSLLFKCCFLWKVGEVRDSWINCGFRPCLNDLSLHLCLIILFTFIMEGPAALEGVGGGRQLNELLAQTLALHYISALWFYLLFYLKRPALSKVGEGRDNWMNCWLRPWLYHYISALWFFLLLNLKVLPSGRCERGKTAEWTARSDPGCTTTFLSYDCIFFFTWRSCALEGEGGERQLNELLAQTLALPLHKKGRLASLSCLVKSWDLHKETFLHPFLFNPRFHNIVSL